MLFKKKLEYIYINIMSNSFVFINDNNELHKLNMNVTSNQNDLTFDNNLIINGNVGIGNTTPSEKLHVNGNANIGGVLNVYNGIQFSSYLANNRYLLEFKTNQSTNWPLLGTESGGYFIHINNVGDVYSVNPSSQHIGLLEV